jgi:hypothetical protein
MIALVLHYPRVKVLRLALETAAIGIEAAIANAPIPGHDTAQPGNTEATFPSIHHLFIERLDLGAIPTPPRAAMVSQRSTINFGMDASSKRVTGSETRRRFGSPIRNTGCTAMVLVSR